jgi:hypothetical protein
MSILAGPNTAPRGTPRYQNQFMDVVSDPFPGMLLYSSRLGAMNALVDDLSQEDSPGPELRELLLNKFIHFDGLKIFLLE